MRSYFFRHYRYLLDLIFLAAIFWAARYLFSAEFGLYEDDITRIPDAFSMRLGDVWEHLVFLMTRYYANRPLHEGFIYFFSWLGWRVNGLWGAYWIGFLITIVNIMLFYCLLRKLHSRLFSFLGGLAYALFSADTTQAYLTMSLGGQLSNTLLLLAFYVYLFGPRWISYVLVYPIILFSYETPFLVFMAAPLLDKPKNGRQFWKAVLLHAAILTAMLLSSFIMRYAQGGSIDFEMGLWETFYTALTHVLQGPLVALGTYLLRPYQVLMTLDPVTGMVSLLSFLTIALYLHGVNRDGELMPDFLNAIRARRFSDLDERTRLLLQLTAAGFVMLLLAYPMTFTTRVTAISGRTTRGHLAAVGGASLLVASFSYALLMVFTHYRHVKIAIALLSGWFAMLVGFGIILQQDYVKAWQYQKDFWAELLPLIPDADIGTAILIQPEGLEDVLQIGANTWNLSRVLDQLYIFPPGMTSVPRVFRLLPNWRDKLALDGGGYFQVNGETVTAPPDNYNTFDSSRVIIISTEGGKMTRIDGSLIINGTSYPLKPLSDLVLPNLPRRVLYQLILDSTP
jgi:hypothetical protein